MLGLALSHAVAGEPSSLHLNVTLSSALHGDAGARLVLALPDGFSVPRPNAPRRAVLRPKTRTRFARANQRGSRRH